MKTENPRLLLIVYLCWGSQGQPTESAPSITNVTVGGSFQFPFRADGNQSYRVELLCNSVLITRWVVHQSTPFINVNYKGRVKILETLIQLDNLQLSDSGVYEVNVDYFTETKQQSERFHLQVLEPVSKPNITAQCLGSNVTLACNSSQGTNVEYSWETAPPCGSSCLVHLGPVVQIPFADTQDSIYYTCTARNEVSNQTSDPLELKLCSTQPAAGFNWIVALWMVIPALYLTGAVIYIQRSRRGSNTADTAEDGFLSPAPTTEPEHMQEMQVSSCAVYSQFVSGGD